MHGEPVDDAEAANPDDAAGTDVADRFRRAADDLVDDLLLFVCSALRARSGD
jgi:hypothetical protein